jgi:hypothetical protein
MGPRNRRARARRHGAVRDTLVDVDELHMQVCGGLKRNEVKWQNQLLPGDYRLTARTDDGRVAQQQLVVGANASPEPVVLEFPPR